MIPVLSPLNGNTAIYNIIYVCRYGLLGPSGCGKTTLLRCIIGRLAIDHGFVSTLGKVPGSVGHNVPGRMVGYMPQVHTYWYTKNTISQIILLFVLNYYYFLCIWCITGAGIV